MASKLGEVYVAITGRLGSLKKSLAVGRRLVDKFGRAMIRLARKGITSAFKLAGRIVSSVINKMKTLVKWTGLAAAGFIAWSIKFGAGFEQSMARVKALTGATIREFESLTETARSLGRQTVFTAKEAADAMGFLALAGFETNKIMAAMPHVLNLAAAGQLEIASAADITAKIMAGMGIESKDLGHTVDVLTKAFTTSNTNLEQLGEALKFVGPVGRATGKSLEEIVAVLQLLADAGLQGSLGGTSLRNMLTRLTGGIPAQARALKKLGVVIADDAGKMKSMADIVDQLNERLASLNGEAARNAVTLGIFGMRAGPGMQVLLAQGGDALRANKRALGDVGDTAKTIASILLSTLVGSFIKLKSVIADVAIAIETRVGPTLKAYVDNATKWVKKNKDVIADWATFFVSKTIEAIKDVVEWFAMLKDNWQKAMKFLNDKIIETVTKIKAKVKEVYATMAPALMELATIMRPAAVAVGEAIGEGIVFGLKTAFKVGIKKGVPAILKKLMVWPKTVTEFVYSEAARRSGLASGGTIRARRLQEKSMGRLRQFEPEAQYLPGERAGLFGRYNNKQTLMEISESMKKLVTSNQNIDDKTKDQDTIS